MSHLNLVKQIDLGDHSDILNKWYTIPIMDLTTCVDFRSELGWIAKKLSISPVEVADALIVLIRLGLIEEVEGIWQKSNEAIIIPTEHSSVAIRDYHVKMMKLATNLSTSKKAERFLLS